MRDDWISELSDWIGRCSVQQTPMLGLCFGHQIIGHTFGGTVFKRTVPEVGVKSIHVHQSQDIFANFDPQFFCICVARR